MAHLLSQAVILESTKKFTITAIEGGAELHNLEALLVPRKLNHSYVCDVDSSESCDQSQPNNQIKQFHDSVISLH